MKRVTSLRKKKRINVVFEDDNIIITTPRDHSLPSDTLDLRCKAEGKLLARSDKQGLSFKCDWCHEVQVITWEQLQLEREKLDQMPGEASDKRIPIYCPNCMSNEAGEQEATRS